jgi:hypothetical protein
MFPNSMVTKAGETMHKTHKNTKPKFLLHILNRTRGLKIAQRSTTELLVPRSTTKMRFRTPPTVLPLMVGGRGGLHNGD